MHYSSDKPIELRYYDRLNRGEFAEQLAKTLLNLHKGSYNDTFTVGLYGKWGCGKTSILELTLSSIRTIQHKEKTSEVNRLIDIRFKPWNFSDTNQLMQQFFAQLAKEFRANSKENAVLEKIGDALDTYSEAFELLPMPDWVKALKRILQKNIPKKLDGKKDVAQQKKRIENALYGQPNRILIIMDDLDRLSSEQIRCVFQLVTSVANFPKVTYLLVFDKDIVVQALAEVQKGRGEDYLEKVIQVPIEVPEPDYYDLRRVLDKRIGELKMEFPAVAYDGDYWDAIYTPCIAPFVGSLRDVNRLCNMLRFKLGVIAPEVNLADLAAITLLEMKHPKVYRWVRARRGIFTDLYERSQWFKENKQSIEDILEKKIREESSDAIDIDTETRKVFRSLERLFPVKSDDAPPDKLRRSQNRIGHPDKFDRYFSLNIRNVGFQTSDVLYFLQEMSEDEIPAALLRMGEETCYDFLVEVEARIDQLTAERAKQLVRAFFAVIPRLNEENNERRVNDMLFPLLERIPEAERTSFFAEFIHSATKETMINVAWTMHIMRDTLMMRGNEDGWDTNGLKEAFLQRMEQLSDDESFFRMEHFRLLLFTWGIWDPERRKARLNKLFVDELNVLHHFRWYVSFGVLGYEVDKDYDRYYSIEKVLDAIRHCREDGRFFSLTQDEQEYSAAAYLWSSYPEKYPGKDTIGDVRETTYDIPRSDVSALLAQWRAEYDAAQQKT